MSLLVVHFHPLADSFTAAMRDRVLAGLAMRPGGAGAVGVIELGETPQEPPERIDADTLVLVYPTWWSGQPALLTRWLADALPRLGTVHRVIAVTSHGSPKRINLLEGETGRRILRKVVLPRCAAGARFEWIAFYGIDDAPESRRVAFLDRVQRRFATLGG